MPEIFQTFRLPAFQLSSRPKCLWSLRMSNFFLVFFSCLLPIDSVFAFAYLLRQLQCTKRNDSWLEIIQVCVIKWPRNAPQCSYWEVCFSFFIHCMGRIQHMVCSALCRPCDRHLPWCAIHGICVDLFPSFHSLTSLFSAQRNGVWRDNNETFVSVFRIDFEWLCTCTHCTFF